MLVIASKVLDSILIDEVIEVKVLGFRGKKVSLGFTAPSKISIKRKKSTEIYEIKRTDQPAA